MGKPVFQRRTLDIFERERMNAVRLFEAVDRADIRMIERCQHLRFPPETSEPVRIAGESRRKNLDGNLAIQLRVAPEIDLTHPAVTQRLPNFEVICEAVPLMQALTA